LKQQSLFIYYLFLECFFFVCLGRDVDTIFNGLFVGHFKIHTGEDGGTRDLETPFKFPWGDEFRLVLVGVSLWVPTAVASFPVKNTGMRAIRHTTEEPVIWERIDVGLDRFQVRRRGYIPTPGL
jgi:hypothetical protein